MEVTLENSNIKDEIRNLQQTYEASVQQLREKQRQLEAAQVENQLLKMKVSGKPRSPPSCLLPPPAPSSHGGSATSFRFPFIVYLPLVADLRGCGLG